MSETTRPRPERTPAQKPTSKKPSQGRDRTDRDAGTGFQIMGAKRPLTKPDLERDVTTPGRAWQIIGTKKPPARSPKST